MGATETAPVRLSGLGLILREWAEDDVPVMVELFDDEEVARWTPLPSPFDEEAARDRVAKARQARRAGDRLHLAITTDGGRPLGEVLAFPGGGDAHDIEIGYAVGARHRGQGLATRAVRLLTGYAYRALGADRVLLRIEAGNAPSAAVARAAGFALTDEPPDVRDNDGRRVTLQTWCHVR